jgi:hypothetical protein
LMGKNIILITDEAMSLKKGGDARGYDYSL